MYFCFNTSWIKQFNSNIYIHFNTKWIKWSALGFWLHTGLPKRWDLYEIVRFTKIIIIIKTVPLIHSTLCNLITDKAKKTHKYLFNICLIWTRWLEQNGFLYKQRKLLNLITWRFNTSRVFVKHHKQQVMHTGVKRNQAN